MKKELLFSFSSPSRDDLNVYGYRFGKKGSGKKIAIVSGLNGEEIAGVFVCSQIVKFLKEKSKENGNFIDAEILIIPSVNHFALNMGNRFWPLDNTDINIMFPGYDKGETTQRIAYRLFESIKDADYGIVIEDRKDKAHCIPYVKLIDDDLKDPDGAKKFGLSLVHLKEFSPTDSGSLLYNWGVWDTKAYSIVLGNQNILFKKDTQIVIDAIVRFLSSIKAIKYSPLGGYSSELIRRENIDIIKSFCAGIFKPSVKAGDRVKRHQILGTIFDPMDGEIKEKITSNYDGIVTCIHNYSLIYQYSVAFRVAKFE